MWRVIQELMETFQIDGRNFSTLEEFFSAISKVLIPGAVQGWIHNLDAFNDLLYRGDEIPREGFTLVWRNSELSKVNLGYPETIRQLEKKLSRCHPVNTPIIQDQIELAKQGNGQTIFDEIIEIIMDDKNISLILD